MEREKAQESAEVLVAQVGGEVAPQVLQALRERRHRTRIVTATAEIPAVLKELQEPVVIVEAGVEDERIARTVSELIELAGAGSFPLIFTGSNAEQVEKLLGQHFRVMTTLNLPYNSAEILGAVRYVARAAKQERAKQQPAETPEQAAAEPPPAEGTPRIHAAYADYGTIPELIFAHIEKLGVMSRRLGAEIYARSKVDENYLISHGMMPKEDELRTLVSSICTDAGKWGRHHLARVSYSAQRMIEVMNPDDALREQLKAASFLYAWSFAGEGGELLKRPYHDARGAVFREELCSRMKDSAMRVAVDLKLSDISRIISSIGRLVGGEETPGDDDSSIVASMIMGADLMSRVCFPSNSWNPRRAHQLFNRIKAGKLSEMHPAVLCCMVKFIAEGIAAQTPLLLLPKEVRKNKELLDALKAARNVPVGSGETRVPLEQLLPGMKLSQPLKTLDGKEILSGDLTLDQDLIWRLWQLSSIRPLFSPIVSEQEH